MARSNAVYPMKARAHVHIYLYKRIPVPPLSSSGRPALTNRAISVLFLGMGTVAKRLVGRFAATAHEGPLFNHHTPVGKHDTHMPADAQRATLDYFHDHLGLYRYNGFFHSCSFFSCLFTTKQPIESFCLGVFCPIAITIGGAEQFPRPRLL